MSTHSLACGVNRQVYEAFLAKLPEGKSINRQIQELVDAWLAEPEMTMGLVNVQINNTAEGHGSFPPAVTESDILVDSDDPPEADEPDYVAEPDSCLHPRGQWVRDGRAVRCAACGSLLPPGR